MTQTQGWIVIFLLAVIASAISALVPLVERFVRVVIHQRELLQGALRHTDDDAIRFELKVFLEEANKPAHAENRRRVDQFLKRGATSDQSSI